MTTYHWAITQMQTVPLPLEPNFVVFVNYLVLGTDGDYTGTFEGTAYFPQDPNQPAYIPYRDLTEAIVLGWVQASLEPTYYDTIYGGINGVIEDKKNPPPSPEPKPLPWVI
jgi:hypothetical protein